MKEGKYNNTGFLENYSQLYLEKFQELFKG